MILILLKNVHLQELVVRLNFVECLIEHRIREDRSDSIFVLLCGVGVVAPTYHKKCIKYFFDFAAIHSKKNDIRIAE